jgi:hypothetical protein
MNVNNVGTESATEVGVLAEQIQVKPKGWTPVESRADITHIQVRRSSIPERHRGKTVNPMATLGKSGLQQLHMPSDTSSHTIARGKMRKLQDIH